LDLVRIFPIDNTLRGYARLEGYVLRPGDYSLKPGMRLSALLVRPGGRDRRNNRGLH
jgi:hypothetical protein